MEDNKVLNFRLPSNVYFGFEKGINKQNYQDVLTFINKYVKDNLTSKRNSFFKIRKVIKHAFLEDGYFFEIHEGGEGLCFGEDVLSKFEIEENNIIFLEIKDRVVQVIRKLNRVETHYLTENYEIDRNKVIEVEDKRYLNREKKYLMEHVFKDKYTFFIVGVLSLVSSLVYLISIFIAKYGVLQLEEPYTNVKDFNIFPNAAIRTIDSTSNLRVVAIEFKNNEWILKRELLNEQNESVISEQKLYIDQRAIDFANTERQKLNKVN